MPIVRFIYDYEEYVDLGNGVAKSKKPDIDFTIELDQKPTIEQVDMLYDNWLKHVQQYAKLKDK
jgi:hypothetical protein|tara:strand:- start:666 stop:857 length:192 start_codon:yes stop_codon:yes gene_type:complete